MDMRDLAGGFSTTEAALAAPERPAPDARGVISYPNYQVAVAQPNDTVSTIAARLGYDAQELAAFNGLTTDTPLRRDELVALPRPVAASPAAAPAAPLPATLPAAAPAPAAAVTTTPLSASPAATPAAAPPPFGTQSGPPAGVEPIRHQVQRGETAYSVARLYGVPVRTVAEWNGLGSDLAVREGQFLLVPPTPEASPAAATPQPGEGSPTPVPPSAAAPLPQESPAPASTAAPPPPAPVPQDLGREQTAAPASRLVMPVQGPIIRAYAPGRNEGIDIGAPAGTEVKAADAGTVAAITTNTDGIQIVVIRHAGDLLTVYTHLDRLTVQKDQQVSRGQTIGRVREGDPSFLHFEVRRGMQSTDPTDFLP
ncbi:peptidoglycan DD-metalloendopeptidase family protein [Rubellimicrobium sp. CFH 75288]|nr:peptidoglycan DD-metalloendopeptidase family protein [Rubellimicrobium sp. CFH 75288]